MSVVPRKPYSIKAFRAKSGNTRAEQSDYQRVQGSGSPAAVRARSHPHNRTSATTASNPDPALGANADKLSLRLQDEPLQGPKGPATTSGLICAPSVGWAARDNRAVTRASMPSVIFLNGASSSGKTTLGRALQDSLDEPYLLMGLDTCFAMVPAQWAGGRMGAHREQGFQYVDLPDENGKPVSGISYGPVGLRMLQGFHRAVREFVQAGNPVIVDEMMLGPEVRDHWFATLAGLDVVSVGVRCDLDELERRESARKGTGGTRSVV